MPSLEKKSFIRKLIKHSSTYMVGEVVIMLGGFISFPIFARILTKEEYGVMNLIMITLSVIEEFSTLGIRHAINRFYSEYEHRNQGDVFYATTIQGSLLFGVAGSMIAVTVSKLVTEFGGVPSNTGTIFKVAAFLVVTRVLTKVAGSLFRMRQCTKTYTLTAVLTKYLGMGTSIVLVSFYFYGLMGYFLGLLAGELTALGFIAIFMVREIGLPRKKLSVSVLKEVLSYGFPLIIAGFASMLLVMGDRYLIGYFMTAADVAVYCVPYNLCYYLQGILVTGLEFAYMPLIMNSWKQCSEETVVENVQYVIRLYCMIAIPIIVGVVTLGEQFITVVASKKYAEAAYILPYVISAEMIMGLSTPLMIGLVFHQQTRMIARLRWGAALLNVALNLVMIPTMHLTGAALSTLICYVLFLYMGNLKSGYYLKVRLPLRHIGSYAASAAFMFAILKLSTLAVPGMGLLVLVPLGATAYLMALLVADRDTRVVARSALSRYGLPLMSGGYRR